MIGKLFLIPTFLSETSKDLIPATNLKVIHQLRVFIAEREKTARAFLKSCETPIPQNDLVFLPMDKRSTDDEFASYLEHCLSGEDMGLVSEAGLPCVADPGAKVVNLAQSMGIEVVPMQGMSSIMLALMASGFNGQSFRFIGYLPHDKKQKVHVIRELEKRAGADETQIFIETPYRNHAVLEELTRNLHPETSLCIASDLTGPNQQIRTRSIQQWKNEKIDIHKIPAVFLIGKRQ